jgi:hypothetical protein
VVAALPLRTRKETSFAQRGPNESLLEAPPCAGEVGLGLEQAHALATPPREGCLQDLGQGLGLACVAVPLAALGQPPVGIKVQTPAGHETNGVEEKARRRKRRRKSGAVAGKGMSIDAKQSNKFLRLVTRQLLLEKAHMCIIEEAFTRFLPHV